ncbi:hypothetical protein VPH35_022611 [Triticum aestivum]
MMARPDDLPRPAVAETPECAKPKSQSLASMLPSRRTLDALMSPWTTAWLRPSWRYSSAVATWNAIATRRDHGRGTASSSPPWSRWWRSPLGAYSKTSTPSSRSSQ